MNPAANPAEPTWTATAPSGGAGGSWLAQDQAWGLRQMFGGQRFVRLVPVVSNPHLLFGGVVLERLCSALAEVGLRTLVADAGERAGLPRELAEFDLREGVEQLSPNVMYLAARGLPLRHVDARGSSAGFLSALAEAAPTADVILVHASAADLARMFGQAARRDGAHRLRPLVLADGQAAAITHAYAAIKLLAQRAGLLAHDLILCAGARSADPAAVAERLAQCADAFLGAVQHGWLAIDPMQPPQAPPGAALCRLVRELVACALPLPQHSPVFAHEVAALPARPDPVLN